MQYSCSKNVDIPQFISLKPKPVKGSTKYLIQMQLKNKEKESAKTIFPPPEVIKPLDKLNNPVSVPVKGKHRKRKGQRLKKDKVNLVAHKFDNLGKVYVAKEGFQVSLNSTGTTTQSLIQNRKHRGTCSNKPPSVASLPFSLSDISMLSMMKIPKLSSKTSANFNTTHTSSTISISSSSHTASSLSDKNNSKRNSYGHSSITRDNDGSNIGANSCFSNPPVKINSSFTKSGHICYEDPSVEILEESKHFQPIPNDKDDHTHLKFQSKETNLRTKLLKKNGSDCTSEIFKEKRKIVNLKENSSLSEVSKHPKYLTNSKKLSAPKIDLQDNIESNLSSTSHSSNGSNQNNIKSTSEKFYNLKDEVKGPHLNHPFKYKMIPDTTNFKERSIVKVQPNTKSIPIVPAKMVKSPKQNCKVEGYHEKDRMETSVSAVSNLSYHTCLSTLDISNFDVSMDENNTLDTLKNTSKLSECSQGESRQSLLLSVNERATQESSKVGGYLNENSKKCLENILQVRQTAHTTWQALASIKISSYFKVISCHYDTSLSDCMTCLQKNLFNLLMTLQEMQRVNASSSPETTQLIEI